MIKKDYLRRDKKKIRIRKKILGTADRPRMNIFRSINHIYAQLIDDSSASTLVSASTKSAEIADKVKKAEGKIAKSALVGELLAEKAKEKGISSVVFDRSGYKYHGRVKAVADGARKSGLQF